MRLIRIPDLKKSVLNLVLAQAAVLLVNTRMVTSSILENNGRSIWLIRRRNSRINMRRRLSP
jgi:hypothetical protein